MDPHDPHTHHSSTEVHRPQQSAEDPSRAVLRGDDGMATAEYAIATLAACGFAALLVTVLGSDQVRGLLLAIVQRALTLG